MTPDFHQQGADYARHTARVRRLAQAILGDGALAEDVVQEAWVLAWTRPPRAHVALGAWLATVVRRLALNLRRERELRAAHEGSLAPASTQAGQLDVLARIELEQRLLERFAHLREPYRTSLYLRYWEGLEPKAIAARTGTPLETVKSRLARGLALLRADLGASDADTRRLGLGLHALAYPKLHPLPTAATAGGSSLAFWTSTLLMKKTAIALLVVVTALLGWRIGMRSGPTSKTGRGALDEQVVELGQRPTLSELPELSTMEVPEGERASLAPSAPGIALAELLVRVRWFDGRPAADVAIEVLPEDGPAQREERVQVVTDELGQARFPELHPGRLVVFSDRNSWNEVHIAAGEHKELALELGRGEDLLGRVVDGRGAPVAGAEVWLDAENGLWQMGRAITRTDGAGAFRIERLGPQARIGARAAGFVPSDLYSLSDLPGVGEAERRVEIVLSDREECGGVHGRVLAPEGEPVADAWVLVGEQGGWVHDQRDGSRTVAANPVGVRSDADGAFRYPGGLPSGPQPVHVLAPGWPAWSGKLEIVAGLDNELVVLLEPAATVFGRVVDAAGQPVAGVEVSATDAPDGDYYRDAVPPCQTRTGADGGFALRWVPPGERVLVAKDYRRPEIGLAIGRVSCKPGVAIELRLVLDLGAAISGRLVGPQGEALVGWRVWGETEPHAIGARGSGRTGEDGSFVLANLDAGSGYHLVVRAPGDSPVAVRAERRSVPTGTSDLEIMVEDTSIADSRIRGSVRGADGLAPRDCQLTLRELDGSLGEFLDFDQRTGAFDHGPVRAGTYLLQLYRGGQTVCQSEPFELEPAQVLDLPPLELAPGGELELTLVGFTPEQLASARPQLDRSGYATEVLQYENGAFRSRPLAPGPWRLQLGRGGGIFIPEETVTIVADDLVRLRRDARRGVKVPVSCSFADPTVEWQVFHCEIRDEVGDIVSSWSLNKQHDMDSIPGLALPAGEYDLEAWTDAGQRGRVHLLVPEGPACAPPHTVELR